VPCETEDSGLRLVASTVLPDEAVCATKVDGVGSWATAVGKSESAPVD